MAPRTSRYRTLPGDGRSGSRATVRNADGPRSVIRNRGPAPGASAEDVWRHRLEALGNDLLLALSDISLAPAIEAVLGLDAAEQKVLRAAGAEDEGFDPRDLHGLSSRCRGRNFELPLHGSRAR